MKSNSEEWQLSKNWISIEKKIQFLSVHSLELDSTPKILEGSHYIST